MDKKTKILFEVLYIICIIGHQFILFVTSKNNMYQLVGSFVGIVWFAYIFLYIFFKKHKKCSIPLVYLFIKGL